MVHYRPQEISINQEGAHFIPLVLFYTTYKGSGKIMNK